MNRPPARRPPPPAAALPRPTAQRATPARMAPNRGVLVRVQGDVNNDIMKVKTLIYAHLLQVATQT